MGSGGNFIQNWNDALCLPLDRFGFFLPGVIVSEGPRLRRDFTEPPISGQRIHHVP